MTFDTRLGVRLFLFLSIYSLHCFASDQADLDTDWTKVTESILQGDPKSSKSLLRQWITSAKKNNLLVAEAYYQLAALEMNDKSYPDAIYHLMLATEVEPSFISRVHNLRILANWEDSAGIVDGISNSLQFRLGFLLNTDLTMKLLTTGIWTLILSTLFHWKSHAQKKKGFLWGGYAVSVILIVLAGIGMISRNSLPPFGILVSTETDVDLYSDPNPSIQKSILKLPVGTLVSGEKSQQNHIYITRPVVGWIADDQILWYESAREKELTGLPKSIL